MPLRILLFLFVLATMLGGCDSKMTERSDLGLQVRSLATQQACDRGECPCETPVGQILHGAKVTAYSQGSTECDEGCGKYSEQLTCKNGKFEKDIDGLFFKCEVKDCPACTLGNNLITSGTSITAYSKVEVGCTESCDDFKIQRTCRMGTLSGSATYSALSCRRRDCRCLMPDNSSYLSLNGTVRLYSSQNAVCGTTCKDDYSQVRTCKVTSTASSEIFALDGSSSYRYSQCNEPSNCVCSLPNGTLLAHGLTTDLSTVATVGCGLTCASQPKIKVRCNNGALVENANPTKVVDFALPAYSGYQYQCKVDQCVSCSVPGSSISVLHGASYRFYRAASVGCASTDACDYRDRTCYNGVLGGDARYTATSCTKRTCKCDVPGVLGISVPVGSTRPFYSAAAAQCGQSCGDIDEDRVCEEYVKPDTTFGYRFVADAVFTNATCAAPTGCSCSLPAGLNPIADGKTVVLTNQASVPCGKTCDQIPSIGLRCENGTLYRSDDGTAVDVAAPGFPYKYYCKTGICADCPLPGYGNIANNGNAVTLFSKNVMTCSDTLDTMRFQFSCENSVLKRNGLRYDSATDPMAPANWYTSYTVNCPGCPNPDGNGTISLGQSQTFYKWSGTVINGCGQGCKSQVRTCQKNGSLDGDPTYSMLSCNNSCTMEGGGAPPRVCLLRWQNTFVTPDTQIPMYNKRRVGCGDSCEAHMKLARCQMLTGTFDAPLEYMYGACTKVCP